MTADSPNNYDRKEEELVKSWLAPLNEEAAPFSQEIVHRVTRLAGDVFEQTPSNPSTTVSRVSSISKLSRKPRQRSMIAKALVALSALLGTAIWFVSHGPATADVTAGSILDRTTNADSLQLRVTQRGQTANVWVKRPGQIRWEETPTKYRIATGSQLWRIDEETNTYRTETTNWYDEEEQRVDLLSLVGIEGREAARFRRVRPTDQKNEKGKHYQVFRMTTQDREPPVVIEALSETRTGKLQSLAVWPAGNRQGPPLAELALVAQDVEVEDSKFVVAKSLSEDGRIGKLTDSQGIVTLKPMLARRWTPVCRQMLIKPGDWLRTDVRGANAVTLELTSQYRVILGPGSLLELQDPHTLKLHGGEVQIVGPQSANRPLKLIGPKKTKTIAKGTSVHYRLNRGQEFEALQQKPQWLAGYEGSTTNDSLGSLIANVDGRDIPLTVGFHKVKVEIRDQIARTTIEESFVNHTKETLEGVFHFPLPQDASISGFGMWINDELIEADVVEKQRAREIYETILREKRDPGLLEWTGGNIFKARVYPIPGRSEKRIKIVYTQVLPIRGNRYRYSYGLRSELLRKTPVRDLSLDVQLYSALPIKSVECPTHTVRSQVAEHSAKLEFAAQEYTPERDFEMLCEVDSRNSDVTVIPHQRGEDGYFLVQLTPPGTEGHWQREILPDGSPLKLLLVCDTSASMDGEKRAHQEEFVAALLNSLGPKDRFNLAVCDVDCHWYSDKWIAQEEKTIEKVRGWLHDRISLGWTDLSRMTESVLKRVSPKTHVIYIGDGIVTSGTTDAQEFVQQFRFLTDKKRSGTFHAVSVGNSFDSTVLKAVSRAGGGSLRQIGGEQTPQEIAFELLNEIAQPGLKNLKVEFRGLQVAAVYPDKLPNLAAGKQQILIGRYLPQGKNQTGEILITGEQGGKTVRFASRVQLTNAEKGNSFIPRLWGRAHLDHLLAQGSNSFIQDQIIALSEEFHIITPYTSLLVLESDEDRERFGVKRRYQMRDGERFFADGRDQSHMELLQQQMKRAGDWRMNLRRKILAMFSTLGRNTNLFQKLEQQLPGIATYAENRPLSTNGSLGLAPMSGPISGEFFGGGGFGIGGATKDLDGIIGDFAGRDNKASESFTSSSPYKEDGELSDRQEGEAWEGDGIGLDFESPFEEIAKREAFGRPTDRAEVLYEPLSAVGGKAVFDSRTPFKPFNKHAINFLSHDKARSSSFGGYLSSGYVPWIRQLFPEVPAPPQKSKPLPISWKEEALKISQSLIQPVKLKTGGLEILRKTESHDPAWKRLTGVSEQTELFASKQWLSFTQSANSQTIVSWVTPQERGIASRAFHLGQVRKSVARDWEHYHPGQRAYATSGLHETFRDYKVQIEKPKANRVVLRLSYPSQPDSLYVVTIDTNRYVVLAAEWQQSGKMTSRTEYSNHVQVAGVWWPGQIETFDKHARRTSLTVQSVKSRSPEEFANRFKAEVPSKKSHQLLSLPMPSVREAEIATANGSADFEDRLVLLVRSSLNQQWDEVMQQLTAMEKLAPDQPGMKWVRALVLISARKNEEARGLLHTLSDQIVQNKRQDELFLAGFVLNQLQSITDGNERLQMTSRWKPVFDRQPESAQAQRAWLYRKTQTLRSLGRTEDVLPLQRNLAESAPWDVAAQTTYAQDLRNTGDYKAAYAWLRKEIQRDVDRQEYHLRQLHDQYAQMLRNQGRDPELIAFLKEWIKTGPTDYTPYQQFLTALIMGDRLDEANETAKQWLKEGCVPEKLEPPQLARLNAAVYFALGQRYQIYMNWIDSIWLTPLKDTAIYFLDHEHHSDIASRIIDHYRFRERDENDQVRAEVAQRLKASVESLSPDLLTSYVDWVILKDDLSQTDWTQISETLRKRWDAEKDKPQRKVLGNALAKIYDRHFSETNQLPFFRERIARAIKEKESTVAASERRALFQELISRDWKPEYEAEAFALIEQLTVKWSYGQSSSKKAARLTAQIHALHQFVDRMLKARYQADLKKLQDQGHPEKLTRTELAKKKSAFQKSAYEGVAQRLLQRLKSQNDPQPFDREMRVREEWLKWVRLEQMYVDLKLNRNQKQVAKDSWEMLGKEPPKPEPEKPLLSEEAAENAVFETIDALRMQRAFVTVNYLAVRPSPDPELVKRLRNYIAAGLKFEGDAAAPWKQAEFAISVALDEPDELERQLGAWIHTDPFPAPWQLAQGRLLAEQGKIEQAISLFETVKRESRLSPADYAALAGWYLVVDRKRDYRRAKIEVFKTMREYNLQNFIRRKRTPWQQAENPLPTELDEDVLFAFLALFEKSNRPENSLYDLREFYTACRDFRLLQMLPDALMGRTSQQIYPFLNRMKTSVLNEIRKEATADEILKRSAELRTNADSPVDLRALDLLEVLIERQAAEVLNQPGPHTQAAVAALERAFERDWADGEVRQMANFLDQLGTIRQPALSAERLRQLRELHNLTKPGTDDRLFVAWHLAHALFWSHNKREDALAVMKIALKEYQSTHPKGWPAHANTPLDGALDLLQAVKRFAEAEDILKAQIENPPNPTQKNWMLNRLNQCYLDAVNQEGLVSLGQGMALYGNFHELLLKQLRSIDEENHRYRTATRLLDLFRSAKEKKFAFEKDLRRFADKQLPELLETQQNYYSDFIQQTSQVLRDLLSTRDALEFLVTRYEKYPKRYQYNWQNAWQQFASQMAYWREEVKQLDPALEERLLAIVLTELRHDLQTRYSRTRYFYGRHYHFWKAKADDFAKVANAVLKEQENSGRSAVYIADYFYDDLHRFDRAIEILLIAHEKNLLNTSQQITLCDYLHYQTRHAESIPILQPIIEKRPDVMSYRTRLITAYHKSSRPVQLRKLLADTDSHFRQAGRWTESNIALLAQTCLDNNLFPATVKYYNEAIPLHERTAANRGIGNGTLSQYYSNLALAYSGLGNTHEAVDAASAGIVAWGPRKERREQAVNRLREVLRDAKDLDTYVKSLDRKVAKEKQDSPLIRQKIGEVFATRNAHEKAIAQFRIALELQSANAEVREQLIASYDAVNNNEAAIEQTLDLLDLDRHNLALYKKLVERLANQDELAERAATTIVEADPNEAENRQALAEVRQTQNRWSEAIAQWKQVAGMRSLEPTGLFHLAEAQIHEKQFDEAQKTLDKLTRTEWPIRFRNLHQKIGTLQEKIPRSR